MERKLKRWHGRGKTGEMEAGKIHPSRRSFRLKKKTKDDIPSIPFLCRPEPPFLSPRAKRGVPRRLRASGRQGGKCHPEPTGEGSPWGRRPERSEGCLAIVRQDKKGRSGGQSRWLLEQPQSYFFQKE
jgi:hypothetical protein